MLAKSTTLEGNRTGVLPHQLLISPIQTASSPSPAATPVAQHKGVFIHPLPWALGAAPDLHEMHLAPVKPMVLVMG